MHKTKLLVHTPYRTERSYTYIPFPPDSITLSAESLALVPSALAFMYQNLDKVLTDAVLLRIEQAATHLHISNKIYVAPSTGHSGNLILRIHPSVSVATVDALIRILKWIVPLPIAPESSAKIQAMLFPVSS